MGRDRPFGLFSTMCTPFLENEEKVERLFTIAQINNARQAAGIFASENRRDVYYSLEEWLDLHVTTTLGVHANANGLHAYERKTVMIRIPVSRGKDGNARIQFDQSDAESMLPNNMEEIELIYKMRNRDGTNEPLTVWQTKVDMAEYGIVNAECFVDSCMQSKKSTEKIFTSLHRTDDKIKAAKDNIEKAHTNPGNDHVDVVGAVAGAWKTAVRKALPHSKKKDVIAYIMKRIRRTLVPERYYRDVRNHVSCKRQKRM